MPVTKTRISLDVPKTLNRALVRLANRDRISVAAKTLDLVRRAMEIEEDAFLLDIAQTREKKKTKFVSHRAAWV